MASAWQKNHEINNKKSAIISSRFFLFSQDDDYYCSLKPFSWRSASCLQSMHNSAVGQTLRQLER